MRPFFALLSLGLLSACATAHDAQREAALRERLRDAMQRPVSTRAERDAQSRLLAEIVDQDAVRGLTRPEVRAAFGPGKACAIEICRKNGFTETDWYYEIGVAQSSQIKQLPLLLFGFDPHERAVRVYTLTTH